MKCFFGDTHIFPYLKKFKEEAVWMNTQKLYCWGKKLYLRQRKKEERKERKKEVTRLPHTSSTFPLFTQNSLKGAYVYFCLWQGSILYLLPLLAQSVTTSHQVIIRYQENQACGSVNTGSTSTKIVEGKS